MENETLNEDMLAFKKRDTIRISRDISDKEKATIGRRKAKVQNCLQKLGVNCTMSSVSNIAILGSGGGLRAMIALQGVLVELQKQGLLDVVMYLCGVSGSTWCMSYIYEHELWVTQLPNLEKKLCDKLTNTAWDPKKALDALVEPSKDDTYSLTDLWGNVIVYAMVHELDDHKLSEERRVSLQGKVPYPIYAAVESNKLADNSKTHPEIWFEFTPDEAGFIHPGAFVDMRLFGSVFENGKLRKIKEEKSLSYLRGLWGSAIASPKAIEDFIKKLISGIQNSEDTRGEEVLEEVEENEEEIVELHHPEDGSGCHCLHCRSAKCVLRLLVHAIEKKTHENYDEHISNLMELLKGSPDDILHLMTSANKALTDIDQEARNTYNRCIFLKDNYWSLGKSECVTHILTLAETLHHEFTARISPHIIHEETKRSTWDVLRILRKTISCISEWKWGTISSYLYKFSGLNDKDLIGQEDIQLVDAGLAINSAYPLVLRPEREVKLILSFDFSEGDPFETVKQAALYCKESQIPFPDIDASELDKSKDNPSDCYIFQSNNAPVVMHFPLFNKVNCRDKVDEWREKYSTLNLSYTEEELKDLLEAAKTNVRNNAGRILQAVKNVSIPS